MSSTLSQIGKITMWTGISFVGLIIFAVIFLPDTPNVAKDNASVPVSAPMRTPSLAAPQILVSPPVLIEEPLATNPLDRLSSTDKSRLREITTAVMQENGMPTTKIYQEFWGIWGKMSLSQQDYGYMRLIMVGASADYQKLFWEDAMTAFQTGRPFKSNEREQLEKKLQEAQLMTNFRVQQNDDFIEKVAKREPINAPQGTAFITDVEIRNTLDNIEAITQRINRLFTPPIK